MRQLAPIFLVVLILFGGGVLYYVHTDMNIRQQLDVTSGSVDVKREGVLFVDSPQMRAYFKGSNGNVASLEFTYHGPTKEIIELDSGEVRQQVGLKLRAADTCNTLYIMWHIDPAEGIVVSAKRNPGEHTHEECGASGYTRIDPSEHSASAGPVIEGETKVLKAELDETMLSVHVDGELVWEGIIPAEHVAAHGHAGMRSDNVVFEAVPNWE